MGPVPASWVSQTPGTSRASFPLPMGGEPPDPRTPPQRTKPAGASGDQRPHGGGLCPGRRSPVSSRDSSREKGGALGLGSLGAPTRIHSSPPGSCSVPHQRPASLAAPPRQPLLAPGGASVLWEEPCEVATSRPLSQGHRRPGPGPLTSRRLRPGAPGRGLGVGPPRAPPGAAPPPPPPGNALAGPVRALAPALGLLALALLLALLELAQPPSPRVPPLDHQAALVGHDAALVG